jgi:hypothetical protein
MLKYNFDLYTNSDSGNELIPRNRVDTEKSKHDEVKF